MRTGNKSMIILAAAMVLILSLSGCFLGDFHKYDYIVEHWRGEWSGWLEVSDAVGTYKKWNGRRIPVRAEMEKNHKRLLLVTLYDEEGEILGFLQGSFKDDEDAKYGRVDILEAIDTKNTSVVAQIQVDGESHGDENLGILSGRIGDKKNGLDVLIRLRRITQESEDDSEKITMTVRPSNSGVDEFGDHVGYGEGQSRTWTIQEGDCFYEWYGDELKQNSNADGDGFLYDKYMEIKGLKADRAIVNTGGEDWEFPYGDTRSLFSLVQVMDGASTSYSITMEKGDGSSAD